MRKFNVRVNGKQYDVEVEEAGQRAAPAPAPAPVSYTHLRAHET